MTAFWATLKVFPFATEIGWPVNGPYHDRVPVLDVMSSDAIDHVPPEPFVHDRPPETFGSVTFDPADDAVDAVVIDVPPAVYPVPVSSVPAADAVLSVEFSRIFIAALVSAVNEPGTPLAPVGSVAFMMFDACDWSSAPISAPYGLKDNLAGDQGDRHRAARLAARVRVLCVVVVLGAAVALQRRVRVLVFPVLRERSFLAPVALNEQHLFTCQVVVTAAGRRAPPPTLLLRIPATPSPVACGP